MLILSRKKGESLSIGNAVIYITKIAGDRVTIGIEAPETTKVLRTELERNQPCNEAANEPITKTDTECQPTLTTH